VPFFKSLRARIIASFVLIVVITLIAAGLALYARLGSYQRDLTTANLEQIAAPIYYNLSVPSRFTSTQAGGQRLRQELQDYIRLQREETGVTILFLNASGAVINDFTDDTDTFADEQFEVPPPPARGPNFTDLPSGTYTTSDGDELLYVTVPMPQNVRQLDAGIHAIVVALQPSAGPDVFRDLRQRLIFAGFIGSAAALVVGVLIWLSLYRPMAKVTTGIRAVARGDYRQRVPVSGPTELRALATDVNTMADSVQASQRTLREFLAMVSHELKTPITSIRGFSEALQDGTLETPEERARAARVIDAESRRLLHLVDELLDLSRIESGQQRMDVQNVRVSELLVHVRDVFALRTQDTGIALEIDTETDAVVLADFDRIEQVLGNLIDNAFRHSPAGGRIVVGSATTAGALVEVFVRDEGAGIGDEDLPHVFDRFYRSEAETAGSGAGLGLAISKEIVLAHGGEIRATSSAGGGSEFTFTLPLAPRPEQPRPSSSAADSRSELGQAGV
jgi:signal transduction histidine kinase